jgi:hypothetical protein
LQSTANATNFATFLTTDCGACYTKSSTAKYCYNSFTENEYCCSSNDTSNVNCIESTNITCSPTTGSINDFYYTYCKGAVKPTDCGVHNLDLTDTADGNWRTVNVNYFPAFTLVNSTAKQYRACYYTISVPDYTWRAGGSLKLYA